MDEHPSDQKALCSITGLVVHRRPAWSGIDCGDDCRLDLEIIAGRIIHARLQGRLSPSALGAYAGHREKLLAERFQLQDSFVELLGLGGADGLAEPDLRQEQERLWQGQAGRCLAQAVYAAPLRFSMALRLRQLVQGRLPLPISIHPDYAAAVRHAVAVATQHDAATKLHADALLADPQWQWQDAGRSVEYRIVPNLLCFVQASGWFDAAAVQAALQPLEKIFASGYFASCESYYRLLDWSQMQGASPAVRRTYVRALDDLHARYELVPRLSIIVGANRKIRAMINVARIFYRGRIRLVDDLEQAFASVASDMQLRLPGRARAVAERHRRGESQRLLIRRHELEHLLQNIGAIAYPGSVEPPPEVPPEHPLADAWDVVACVGRDLRELIEQRRKREVQLAERIAAADSGRREQTRLLQSVVEEVQARTERCEEMASRAGELALPMRAELDQLRQLLGEVQHYVQQERGQRPRRQLSCDGQRLLDALADVGAVRAGLCGLEFSASTHGEVPERIRVDLERLQQIVVRLIEHVCRRLQAGRIDLRLQVGESEALRLSISAEGAQRRATETVASLNLLLATQLLRGLPEASLQHSEEAGQLRFELRLPIPSAGAPSDEDRDEDRDEVDERPKAGAQVPIPAGAEVLIIEAGELAAQALADLLRHLGCSSRQVHDRAAALLSLREAPPAIVLQAVTADELHATQLAELRAATGGRVPFVAVLAGLAPELSQACRAAGYDDLLVKPITLPVLAPVLSRCLNDPPA